MKELPYTNSGKTDAHIGGKVIKPGHTRMVDASMHPDYHKLVGAAASAPATAGEKRTTELKELLATKGGAAAVLKLVGDGAGFGDADLAELKALESGAKHPRTTIIKGIEEIQLKRASEAAGSGGGEGILGMLGGEDVAAGITAADDLTLEDLDKLEAAESAGKKRQDVLLAIEGKSAAIRTAAARELLASPDVIKQITEGKDFGKADLELLEQLEMGSPDPRDAVVDAIGAKLKDLPAEGGLRGLFGFGRKKS